MEQINNQLEILKSQLSELEEVKEYAPSVIPKIQSIEKEIETLEEKKSSFTDIKESDSIETTPVEVESEDTRHKLLTLNDLLKELDEELKLNGKYLFMDNSLGRYVKIDLHHKNTFKNSHGIDEVYFEKVVDYIEKGSIHGAIKNTIKNLQYDKKLDPKIDKYNSDTIRKIVSRIDTISQKFNRHQQQIYIANDMTVLNEFVRTPLINFKPTNLLSYSELRTELTNKFPRTEILFQNNLLDNEKHIEYVLNWISAECNVPSKVKTSIVLIGEQGSGKSLLTETIFRENLYDKTNVSIMSNSVWTDKFNSVFEGKTFLINNEISLSGRKETNDISELIKRLITDDTVFIRGMRKENVEKEVTFSQWFLSNQDEPLKIEFGDRRFSIFGRADALEDNKNFIKFLKDNNESMEDFIPNIKKEIREFLYLVKSLDFDSKVCITPMKTYCKDRIIFNSNTNSDLLKSAFNTNSWESFESLLNKFEMNEGFIKQVKKMFEVGIFPNDILYTIYITFFHGGNTYISNIESGKWWNGILSGVQKPVYINKTDTRVKVFKDIYINEKIEILKLITTNQDFSNQLLDLRSLELKGFIEKREVPTEVVEIQKEDDNTEVLKKPTQTTTNQNTPKNLIDFEDLDEEEVPF